MTLAHVTTMRHTQETSIHRFLYSRVMLIVSVAFCVFIFFQLIKVVQKSAETEREVSRLRDERTQLEINKKQLSELRSFLQTDYFAESEARTKFGYKKEGETAIIVTEPPSASDAASDPTSPVAPTARYDQPIEERSTIRLWWDYFFSRSQ